MTATMTPVTPDHELLRRLREGDQHALRDVYDRYAVRVLAVARRTVVDPRTAEDVAQEVFVYLWGHADRVDLGRGSIETFLVMVARQRAVDHVRRESRWRARHERLAASVPGAGSPRAADVADDVVAADAVGRRITELRDAVDRLPDDLRRAVVLAYYHGRTFREVAGDLGLPEGTAKSRLRLALQRLGRDLALDATPTGDVNGVRRAS